MFNERKINKVRRRIREDYHDLHKFERVGFLIDAILYNCDEEFIKAFWLQMPRDVQLEVIGIFDKRIHEIRQEVLQYLIDSRNIEIYRKE